MILLGLLSLSEASSRDRQKEHSWYSAQQHPGTVWQLAGLSLGQGPRRMKSFSDLCPSQKFECKQGFHELSECHRYLSFNSEPEPRQSVGSGHWYVTGTALQTVAAIGTTLRY